MTDEQDIYKEIESAKSEIDFNSATRETIAWWYEFERMNETRPKLILRLASEIRDRSRTMDEFFFAYVHSNKDQIQENLNFLDLVAKKYPNCKRLSQELFAQYSATV